MLQYSIVHTCTHTHTYARTHTNTHTHAHTHICTRMHPYPRIFTHAQTPTTMQEEVPKVLLKLGKEMYIKVPVDSIHFDFLFHFVVPPTVAACRSRFLTHNARKDSQVDFFPLKDIVEKVVCVCV